MRPIPSREVDGVLVVGPDDPLGVNDGQSDLYRRSIYGLVEDLPRPRIALDLEAMGYLSSSGVALLVGFRRRVAAARGALVLFGVHPYVVDVLRAMKLAPLFRFADDEAAAIALLPPFPAV